MTTNAILNQLQVVAASQRGGPNTLGLSKDDAQTVLSAIKCLSKASKEDLLSETPARMAFLARLILNSPTTAYAVLKQNFKVVLDNPVSPKQEITARVSRGPNPAAKSNVLKVLCAVLKEYGINTPKSHIKIETTSKGVKVAFKVKTGIAYSSIMGVKAKLALYYVLDGKTFDSTDDKKTGYTWFHFTITGARKGAVVEKLKKVAR